MYLNDNVRAKLLKVNLKNTPVVSVFSLPTNRAGEVFVFSNI